jgi:hypothetical protein
MSYFRSLYQENAENDRDDGEGAPILKYSRKEMFTSWRALWATIRFATDPRIVRFPASVDAIASTNYACPAFARRGMMGRKTGTAGTLVKAAAETTEKGTEFILLSGGYVYS